jgi:hypothetical protein
MTTRWDEVQRWLSAIAQTDPTPHRGALSPEGIREGVRAALAALSPEAIAQVAALPGRPWPRATLVTTATVPTAALEWLALLIGRGSEVVWKYPSGDPGLAKVWGALAADLPLRVTPDRDGVLDTDVVIVLGSDRTVAQIRSSAPPGTTVFGHGHGWSCAWITGRALGPDDALPSDLQDGWDRLAADAALYDGRGCLSPAIVFTPTPLPEAMDALADAMERAARHWPTGQIFEAEAGLERSRRALARVVGQKRRGTGWSLHGLSIDHVSPIALPRSLAVVEVADIETATRCAAAWGRSLSTVGTDDPAASSSWHDAGAGRVCPLGRMQRPPLHRVHDGAWWVYQTFQAVGTERA